MNQIFNFTLAPRGIFTLKEVLDHPGMIEMLMKLQQDKIRTPEQKLRSFLTYYHTMDFSAQLMGEGIFLDDATFHNLISLCERVVAETFYEIMKSFSKKDKKKLISLFQ
ncbi:hypothetical protein [Ralstonia pseudosolanacearum]|uniref:hypothetical protein n=1 Tax=Ralstonia pseudosolanacearum TaxID=1310165 RepID=UPI001FFAA5ED|nr:hypothetical protein [Ralstonia pseudosolanacearum]